MRARWALAGSAGRRLHRVGVARGGGRARRGRGRRLGRRSRSAERGATGGTCRAIPRWSASLVGVATAGRGGRRRGNVGPTEPHAVPDERHRPHDRERDPEDHRHLRKQFDSAFGVHPPWRAPPSAASPAASGDVHRQGGGRLRSSRPRLALRQTTARPLRWPPPSPRRPHPPSPAPRENAASPRVAIMTGCAKGAAACGCSRCGVLRRHVLAPRIRRRHRQRGGQPGPRPVWYRQARLHHERRGQRRPLERRRPRSLRRGGRRHPHCPAMNLRLPRIGTRRRGAPRRAQISTIGAGMFAVTGPSVPGPAAGEWGLPHAARDATARGPRARRLPRLCVGADRVLQRAPELPHVPSARRSAGSQARRPV